MAMLGFGKSKGPQPPRWYAPAQMASLDLAQYDRAIKHYIADVCTETEWPLIVGLEYSARHGEIGGAQDGASGTGGRDRQEV